jgi:hypothetical protein
MADTILEGLQAYDDEHAWLRQFVIPEEDRQQYTTVKWSGEYRWFKSPNVICLEKVRFVSEADRRSYHRRLHERC